MNPPKIGLLPQPFIIFLAIFAMALVVNSCEKDPVTPTTKADPSWLEEFDTLANAVNRGWVIINNSRPLGTGSWAQGNFVFANGKLNGFPAASYRYSGNDYVYCGFNSGSGSATLSAWMIGPSTEIKNGDELIFSTRTIEAPANFPDRLQVRLNATDDGIDVGNAPLQDGNAATNVGKFQTLLLDINPELKSSGLGSFPAVWTRHKITFANLDGAVKRRIAFRYFVTNGGPSGINSSGVGIDSVAFVSKR